MNDKKNNGKIEIRGTRTKTLCPEKQSTVNHKIQYKNSQSRKTINSKT
jgi:hypothetical protein